MGKAVILAIYGGGGHRAEMTALVRALKKRSDAFELVTLGQGRLPLPVLTHFETYDIRSKHSRLKNWLLTLPLMLILLFKVCKITRQYRFHGVISTGPGLAITPMLLCRMLGLKTVFVETYSRFNTRSLSGRLMAKIAQRFLVQNLSLTAHYPNAEYCGRL